MFWYSFTMFFSKKLKKCPIPIYNNVEEITKTLRKGALYKYDIIAGIRSDYLIHPSVIQCRLENSEKFGDCDDHAIYWCAALKKSKIAKKVWFSFFTMKGIGVDQSYFSHAVCVFTDNEDKMYWCDYKNPKNIEKFSDFQKESANKYGNEPVCSVMWEVVDVKDDDTPVFGKITRILPEKI
jgi:hypothetical protein